MIKLDKLFCVYLTNYLLCEILAIFTNDYGSVTDLYRKVIKFQEKITQKPLFQAVFSFWTTLFETLQICYRRLKYIALTEKH